MLNYLKFQTLYGPYLRSEHGIKKFAEMAMGQLIRKVTKKSAFYREMNENLLVEKANLRMRAEELNEQPMLSAGRFFIVRRRIWANNFIIAAAILASVFIIFISVSAFLDADTQINDFVQWSVAAVLAVVMTGGGLIITERLVESVIGSRRNSDNHPEDLRKETAVLWSILLIGIELGILGITESRADQLSSVQESGILYVGFIALSMLLPIIAGAIRWDAMQYLDRFKTTRAHREIDSRLAQIDSILRQNEEYESNFYKIRSIEMWDLLNEFRTYKDLYNERHGMVEQLGGHFAQSYDAFQREAFKRYESDLRDLMSPSMRRMDIGAERPVGRKIGQTESRLRPAQIPASADRAATSNERAGEQSTRQKEIYLSPKPIR